MSDVKRDDVPPPEPRPLVKKVIDWLVTYLPENVRDIAKVVAYALALYFAAKAGVRDAASDVVVWAKAQQQGPLVVAADGPPVAQPCPDCLRECRTERLTIVDANGKARGVVAVGAQGLTVQAFDAAGKAVVTMEPERRKLFRDEPQE